MRMSLLVLMTTPLMAQLMPQPQAPVGLQSYADQQVEAAALERQRAATKAIQATTANATCLAVMAEKKTNDGIILEALAESRLNPLHFVLGVLRRGTDDGLTNAAYILFQRAFIPPYPEHYPGSEWVEKRLDLLQIGGLLLDKSAVLLLDDKTDALAKQYLETLRVARRAARVKE